MKKLALIFGTLAALFGLISCATEADESSIVGEWGVTEYTYNEYEDRDDGSRMYLQASNLSDPKGEYLAFIFDEDGSGKNVCYGYMEMVGSETQFVEHYISYPFKWSLNNGKLVLNYTAEDPRDSKDSVLESHHSFVVLGTEFKASTTGSKLTLIGDQTIDGHKMESKVKLNKK